MKILLSIDIYIFYHDENKPSYVIYIFDVEKYRYEINNKHYLNILESFRFYSYPNTFLKVKKINLEKYLIVTHFHFYL